jgi:cyclopropane fatty-acyl-phospholipid synthase-like methyltransferase
MRVFVTLLAAMSMTACHHAQPERGWHAHEASQHFANAEDWAQRFDDPKRDEWQKPEQVLQALALTPAMTVADIGAGTGYFSMRLARLVPQGRVYGVDLEPSMVDYLDKRAAREGLANFSAVHAEPADPKLPEAVDLVIVVNTWHHLQDRVAYFSKVLASVKPHGRLAIIDFSKASKMGPPASAKSEPAEVTAELTRAGWTLERTQTFLPEQVFLVYTRP